MSKICYTPKHFQKTSLGLIEQCNTILEDYIGRGFDLTLRQLYYALVSRIIIPNTQQSYKRLGSIVNDARLAGLIDWSYIVDRTRNLQSRSHWNDPGEIISSAAYSYHVDMWGDQSYYIEVFIEKDALIGVIEGPCNKWDVPYFSCRGYTSQSEMWTAAKRFQRKCENEDGYDLRDGILIHLSDHDPSGLDMEKDLENRFKIFGAEVFIERIALTMNQVHQYSLPPNPAKVTDSRFDSYADQWGTDSWELDALDPSVLSKMVEDKIESHINPTKWEIMERKKTKEKKLLGECSDRWEEVVGMLEG